MPEGNHQPGQSSDLDDDGAARMDVARYDPRSSSLATSSGAVPLDPPFVSMLPL
jgi:hypothetical protein